jgi:hypothetical protein
MRALSRAAGRAGLAGLAAAALSAAPPASADDVKTTQDIRCVIVGATLVGSDDPQLKQLGTLSVLYFWGRLQGRDSMANIDARVLEEEAKMSAADVTAQAKTCEALVIAAGQDIQDLSKTLQQHAGGSGGGG